MWEVVGASEPSELGQQSRKNFVCVRVMQSVILTGHGQGLVLARHHNEKTFPPNNLSVCVVGEERGKFHVLGSLSRHCVGRALFALGVG